MEGSESEDKFIIRLKFQKKFLFVSFREDELTAKNFPEKGKLYNLTTYFLRKPQITDW